MATATKPPAIAGMIEPLVNNAKPIVEAILKVLDVAGPALEKSIAIASKIWAQLQPYDPQDWLPVIMGLFLIFFGGQWPLLVGAIEAFRICGWDNTKKSLVLLYDQYKIAMDASRKDDKVDENKDGIADVKQIDTKQLVSRKLAVFMKATDPNAVNTGMQGLAAGFGAVIATLKMRFAQTVTLGVSLGDIFAKTADSVVRPALEKALPKEYHKWVGVMITYGSRSLAVTIAWWLQRIISALHSAMRGAQLLLMGVNKLMLKYKVRSPVDLTPQNPAYPGVTGALGGIGMYTQLVRGFALPFPLSFLLFPVTLLEWVLYYVVAYTK